MTPPVHPALRIADAGGVISRKFHQWLEVLARTATTEQLPVIGSQSPGTFIVADGHGAIHVKRLTLSGLERAFLAGTARLVICG